MVSAADPDVRLNGCSEELDFRRAFCY